ncbi:MAG: hypothetical protein WC869_03710 [Phycisphaerae bacterium]|jgi:hypothetical protein
MGSYSPQWFYIALLAAAYLATCLSAAMQMGRIGRSRARWFLITVFCTAIPAAVVLLRHHLAQAGKEQGPEAAPQPRAGSDAPAAPAGRACPHCGLLPLPGESAPPGPVKTCPRCKMIIREEYYA